MLQLFAALMSALIALGGIALIAATLAGSWDKIVAALADRGEVADPGFVWVARIRRASRPSPALARNRPQPVSMRVAA